MKNISMKYRISKMLTSALVGISVGVKALGLLDRILVVDKLNLKMMINHCTQ